MNRKEQIQNACPFEIDKGKMNAFCMGATWADKHPNGYVVDEDKIRYWRSILDRCTSANYMHEIGQLKCVFSNILIVLKRRSEGEDI